MKTPPRLRRQRTGEQNKLMANDWLKCGSHFRIIERRRCSRGKLGPHKYIFNMFSQKIRNPSSEKFSLKLDGCKTHFCDVMMALKEKREARLRLISTKKRQMGDDGRLFFSGSFLASENQTRLCQ